MLGKDPKKANNHADIQRKQLCDVSRVSSVYRLVCTNSAFQRLFVEKVLPRNQTFSVARE